ncbi:hypothetical protein MCOR25_007444 [Pyricularia grisea]|nr:hypothetical protein MCOR25_007444 [Pyricularia grisea]
MVWQRYDKSVPANRFTTWARIVLATPASQAHRRSKLVGFWLVPKATNSPNVDAQATRRMRTVGTHAKWEQQRSSWRRDWTSSYTRCSVLNQNGEWLPPGFEF